MGINLINKSLSKIINNSRINKENEVVENIKKNIRPISVFEETCEYMGIPFFLSYVLRLRSIQWSF